MTVAYIFLHQALLVEEEEIKKFTTNPLSTQLMAILIATSLVNYASSYRDKLPLDIRELLSSETYNFKIGRCSIQPVSSNWVRETYSTARFQLLVTLSEKESGGRTHTLFIFLP